MDINVKYLSQLKTISTLKVLIAFLAMSEREKNSHFYYPLPDICKDTGFTQNSVRASIKELCDIGAIEESRDKRGKSYRIIMDGSQANNSVVELVSEAPREGFVKVTAAKKKKDDASAFIDDIDFYALGLFDEDINSLSVFNVNTLMTQEERGRLAKRIINEIHKPRVNRIIPKYHSWIAQQIVILRGDEKRKIKGLLEIYRTEQIIAAIRFWTEIETAPNGLMSLSFLKAKAAKGKQDNIMVALDYYKTEYLKHVAPAVSHEEAELRRIEQLRKERDEQEKQMQEKQRIDSMSNEEFVDDFMSQFAGIANKFKKERGE